MGKCLGLIDESDDHPSDKSVVMLMMGELLFSQFKYKDESGWTVAPGSRTDEQRPDFMVLRWKPSSNPGRVLRLNCLFVKVEKPNIAMSHDEIARGPLTARIHKNITKDDTGKCYGTVCIGKRIKFYLYDKYHDNEHPAGEEGLIRDMILPDGNGGEICGVLHLKDDAHKVETMFQHIRQNPTR